MKHNNIEFLPLQLPDDVRTFVDENQIDINKRMSSFLKQAQQQAKLNKCFYCGKNVTSFCNSHSVPKFCLKRIAVNGKLFFANTLIDLPFLKDEQGVNQAGTFQLICNKCDGRVFQQYEDPKAYTDIPSGRILAQIAMKNHLQMIYKRLFERQLFRIYADKQPLFHLFGEKKQQRVIDLDLNEYQSAFARAKVGGMGKHNNYYSCIFYRKLDYIVPVAFQGEITMICDLENKVINDVYNMDNQYTTEPLHISIFPLETSSVVFAFVDSRHKRYRQFAKQIKNLEADDQLALILYIVMSYSENIFYSKTLNSLLQTEKSLTDVSRKNSIALADHPVAEVLSAVLTEYDLSKRTSIPNLLLPQYAI